MYRFIPSISAYQETSYKILFHGRPAGLAIRCEPILTLTLYPSPEHQTRARRNALALEAWAHFPEITRIADGTRTSLSAETH